MKNIVLILFMLSSVLIKAQTTVTESQLILDQEYQLEDKDKRTHSAHFEIPIPSDLLNDYDRIDAVFLSSWIGHGKLAEEQYAKDAEAEALKGEEPVLDYANGQAGIFHYPKAQTGFGIELMLTSSPDSVKWIKRYRKKKIKPRGMWRSILFRDFSTTPVLFHYRFPLNRRMYEAEDSKVYAYLRTSAKKDTVKLQLKMVLTIKGIKKPRDFSKMRAATFLGEAVLVGLKADNFPVDQAKEILRQRKNFFVTKCPICRPVESAITEYLETAVEQGDIKTPNNILLGLQKDNKEDQQIAFSQLINRYIKAYYEELGMTKEEQKRMEKLLEADRKQGMGMKSQSFGKFCPSCDGACKIEH